MNREKNRRKRIPFLLSLAHDKNVVAQKSINPRISSFPNPQLLPDSIR